MLYFPVLNKIYFLYFLIKNVILVFDLNLALIIVFDFHFTLRLQLSIETKQYQKNYSF